ncbi:MAG: CaiB/BaiF CoA transferase family protein [Candidatus Binatia bacterium]
MLPLAKYKMLDLSRQMPGPFCSALLGDLGMDVLHVAAPNDPMGAGLPLLGRNKRSMKLNLKTDAGRPILHRLAAGADVLLEGARPGVTQRLGIDYETLRRLNPRLVYCSITGYGPDGPYRDRVGHDANYLGYAGVLNFIGRHGGPPVIPQVQFADIGAGSLMAAFGILAALLAREETGRGQYVDVAMLDGSFAFGVYPMLLRHLQPSEPERGKGQPSGYHPCYAVYETRDARHLTVAAFEGHFWANLCRHFGREDFIERQWQDGPIREEMMRFFEEAFRRKTLAEWIEELSGKEICFGPVNTISEAFADPQLRHRGMVVEIDTPLGRATTFGVPVKLSETPGAIRTGAPAFGEHTDDVLAALGYAREEIDRFREEGVV